MGLLTHKSIEDRTAYATAALNTDFNPPNGARSAILYWRISAVAGTTPIADCKLQYKDPTSGEYIDIDNGAFTQKTVASFQTLVLDPSVVADTTGDARAAGVPLSASMRAAFTFDRTTGNETYTFTLSADYLD